MTQIPTSRKQTIIQAARMIFSAYRRDDFADPDMFVLQLGIVLERYPDDVIGELSHPLSGIQRRLKRPPSIADIVEAAEAAMDHKMYSQAAKNAFLPEPPIDPEMQARVGELFASLSAKLHFDAAVEREIRVARLHAELHGKPEANHEDGKPQEQVFGQDGYPNNEQAGAHDNAS